MKRILLLFCFFILLSLAGCKDSFKYQLIAEGCVTHIEITGGGFMNPAKKIFYLDNGSVLIFGVWTYEDVKIGDCIYVYERDWDGRIIRRKPLERRKNE